ncbi:LysR family transcriptional regulator [Allopontixanthobacter sediminis]|uniref:LysR family transcriptional regulator n=1 Tax=Allopontixanthobacter sediminis TaxID=1689985 RepID=A0A845B206_9SPHN|nr:LysR family transcriptional regulator [Allopontixanthobacter sediminis]MXP45753.1 LysR family transcriptional regulator [Allopontixanthobacter sediminis]
MRLDNFDLNLLVAFEVLLEERSVTRAAQRLNVTQSAMSASLKRLRGSFQDEILILHGKKMIPTQHALTLAPEVSITLMRLKTLIATGTGFDPATSKRRFQINASDYITTVLLVPLIEHLQVEAPGVRLNLSLPSSQSAARLEAGETDLLLTPDEFLDSDHPTELLFEEKHVVVGSKGNPALSGPMSIERFLKCGHVAVRISNQDTFVETILKKLAPERRIEVAAQSFIQVPWLLRGTNRLAVMHERLAKVTQPIFDLAVVEVPYELPLMREMMQHHISKTRDTGLSWLREKIVRLAQQS